VTFSGNARAEVHLPGGPDAWYAPDSVKIGHRISFTRYFHEPRPMPSLEEVRADFPALGNET